MWLRSAKKLAAVTPITTASVKKNTDSDSPKANSALPTPELSTPPTRATAEAQPTPEPRMAVG
jgi:hypothetical protein